MARRVKGDARVEALRSGGNRRAGTWQLGFRRAEALLHKGPLPVNTIGLIVDLTPGSISLAVDRLVEKGLVRRSRAPKSSALGSSPSPREAEMAALFRNASRRPSSFRTRSAAAAIEARFVTLSWRAEHPFLCFSRPRSRLRDPTSTVNPCAAAQFERRESLTQ